MEGKTQNNSQALKKKKTIEHTTINVSFNLFHSLNIDAFDLFSPDA